MPNVSFIFSPPGSGIMTALRQGLTVQGSLVGVCLEADQSTTHDVHTFFARYRDEVIVVSGYNHASPHVRTVALSYAKAHAHPVYVVLTMNPDEMAQVEAREVLK